MSDEQEDLLALALSPTDRSYLIRAIAGRMRKNGCALGRKAISILVGGAVVELEAGRGRGMTRIAALKLMSEWLGLGARPDWDRVIQADGTRRARIRQTTVVDVMRTPAEIAEVVSILARAGLGDRLTDDGRGASGNLGLPAPAATPREIRPDHPDREAARIPDALGS